MSEKLMIKLPFYFNGKAARTLKLLLEYLRNSGEYCKLYDRNARKIASYGDIEPDATGYAALVVREGLYDWHMNKILAKDETGSVSAMIKAVVENIFEGEKFAASNRELMLSSTKGCNGNITMRDMRYIYETCYKQIVSRHYSPEEITEYTGTQLNPFISQAIAQLKSQLEKYKAEYDEECRKIRKASDEAEAAALKIKNEKDAKIKEQINKLLALSAQKKPAEQTQAQPENA